MSKSGKCQICEAEAQNLWSFNLAEYDSLRDDRRLRFDLCADCATKLTKAMKTIIGVNDEKAYVLACPDCGYKVTRQEPKKPAPCEKCGSVFSQYSSGKLG